MKSSEASQILEMLVSAFHRETLETGTVELWLDILDPLDAEISTKVTIDWVKSQDRFPTIAQFRHAYHSERARVLSEERGRPVSLDEFGLPLNCPDWVQRWKASRRAAMGKDGRPDRDRQGKLLGDWRVFPEQMVDDGPKVTDDPRYSKEEAERLGLMPEDAWQLTPSDPAV